MATATRSLKSQPLPVSSPRAPEAAVPDTMRPYFGDRIAFIIWVTCALLMASLLAFDTVTGLLR